MIGEVVVPPPPPCMRGPHAYSHFLGKGGILGRSLGKISRQNPEKGVFFNNCQIVSNTRDRGVPVMRNKHSTPWFYGRGGGRGIQ